MTTASTHTHIPLRDRKDIPVGGQVPLLKHAIMQWLIANNVNGHVPGDSYDLVRESRASVPNVARALWDLQKQGLITFVERKRAGTDGHASTTVLTRFNLTQKGLAWTPEKGYMRDLATVSSMDREDLNPAARDAVILDEIVEGISKDTPPAQALANLLRRAGGSLSVRRAHVTLGYKPDSTAIYSLTKGNPEIFRITKGVVSFIGPEDWRSPTGPGFQSKNRAAPEPEPEPERVPYPTDLGPYAKPTVEPLPEAEVRRIIAGVVATSPDPRDDYPAIKALITREHKRLKAEGAAKTLEAIGMDEQALSVLGAFPALSDIEREVLSLVTKMGWTDA